MPARRRRARVAVPPTQEPTMTIARSLALALAALVVLGGSGAAHPTFRAQSHDLAGTAWNVTGYNNGKQAVVSVVTGTHLTAVFDPKGHVSGSAGCNSYTGPVKLSAPSITIGPLSATRKT